MSRPIFCGFVQSSPLAGCRLLLGIGGIAALVIGLGVHQLGENLARMAGRIRMVGVLAGLLLCALLAAIAAVDVLVVVQVVVLVFVGVLGRHGGSVEVSVSGRGE